MPASATHSGSLASDTLRAYEAQIRSVAGGGGISAILDQTSPRLRRCDLMVVGAGAEVIEQRGHHFTSEISLLELIEEVHSTRFHEGVLERGRLFIYRLAVRFVNRPSVFLVCISDRRLADDEVEALEQCRLGVLLARTHGAANVGLDRDRIGALYETVLSGTAEVSRVTEVLGGYGIDAIAGIRAIAIATDSLNLTCQVIEMLEEKRHVGVSIAIGEVGGIIFLVVNTVDKERIEYVLKGILRLESPNVTDQPQIFIGISNAHRQLSNLRRALLEARITMLGARKLGSATAYAEESALPTILASLYERNIANYLTSRYIDPLREYDRAHSTELLTTLIQYINDGFRPSVSASALYIHRQTLKYRLDRIAKVVGSDPRRAANMLEYLLAARIYEEFAELESCASEVAPDSYSSA